MRVVIIGSGSGVHLESTHAKHHTKLLLREKSGEVGMGLEALGAAQIQNVLLVRTAQWVLDLGSSGKSWSSTPNVLPIMLSSSGGHQPSIIIQCMFASEVWFYALSWIGFHHLAPTIGDSLLQWWTNSQRFKPSKLRSGVNSVIMHTTRSIWLERNNSLFKSKVASA